MTPVEVLDALARVNLAAGAAILVVIALRRHVRAASGARVAYGLWLLPLMASAAVLLPARRIVATGQVAPVLATGLHLGGPSLAPSSSIPDLTDMLVCLWLAGVLATGLILVRLQVRFAQAARQGLAGPAVIGLFKPLIVTPRDFTAKFSLSDQALILTHEQTHIARHDLWVNGLCCAAQCLGWFNPLIHLAAYLMRIDQELACDEAVVTRFPNARRAYAEVLVKAQLAVRSPPLGCHWPPKSKHPLLERIAMLKRTAFSPGRRWAGACALAVLCAGVGFAAWAAQPADVKLKPSGSPPASMTPTLAAPIDITADRLVVADAGRRTIYRGGASAVQGGDRLMSDLLTVYGSGPQKPMQSLVANGHVLFVSAQRTARADHALYDPTAQSLTLTGDVVALQGHGEFRGQKLVIDLTR